MTRHKDGQLAMVDLSSSKVDGCITLHSLFPLTKHALKDFTVKYVFFFKV